MKIPPLLGSGMLRLYKATNCTKLPTDDDNPLIKPLQKQLNCDTLSFSSNAKYIKKYNSLPPEIKKLLSPQDAIDMFRDMEFVANGLTKRKKIGQGSESKVYENPWLQGYCFIVLQDGDIKNQTVYSKINLGDSVWMDNDDTRIQILKEAS